MNNRSLIDLVVIDTELGRKNNSSILATAFGKGLKLFDVRTDSQTRLNWW
jgi:hypothetical protein